MSKKVASVQSNYIPWRGYFDLINLADEFILYDHVQYTKRDWRNRNKIKTLKGPMWLTIPVKVKNKRLQKIQETAINDPQWGKKHWRTITCNYSKAKYFETYREFFEELYLNQDELFLSRINYRFLTTICQILGINTRISWSTAYQIREGEITETVVDLCKRAGATEFISGPAAKAYYNEELFRNEHITLRYIDYSEYPEYHQLFSPFEHKLSILDLIFNEGPEASKYMKSF